MTQESEEAIVAARAAYDALTADQKALVTNLAALTAAESKLAELQEAAASNTPQTGDDTNLMLPIILMSLSLLGIAFVSVKGFKNKGKYVD